MNPGHQQVDDSWVQISCLNKMANSLALNGCVIRSVENLSST